METSRTVCACPAANRGNLLGGTRRLRRDHTDHASGGRVTDFDSCPTNLSTCNYGPG